MLYRPAIGNCRDNKLAVIDETGGYRGYSHQHLSCELEASYEQLCEYVEMFGGTYPDYEFFTHSVDDRRDYHKLHTVSSLLAKVSKMRIKWTDIFSCHLDFDPTKNTLYLYRYPSFCKAHLMTDKELRTTFHSCAMDPRNKDTLSYDERSEEVDSLLQEILSSYRLLFGQDKLSRRLFKTLEPFTNTPGGCIDTLLVDLCTKKNKNCHLEGLRRQGTYVFEKEFKVLKPKLVTLMREVSSRKARTWRDV